MALYHALWREVGVFMTIIAFLATNSANVADVLAIAEFSNAETN